MATSRGELHAKESRKAERQFENGFASAKPKQTLITLITLPYPKLLT